MEYTIVATTFNDSKNVIAYLDNIIIQSFRPKEIIIADGGSKDNTVELINEYAKKCQIAIKVLSGKRLNIAQGFNEAIKSVTTEYVAITGLGNIYEENCFALLREVIEKENCDFAYPPVRGVNSNKFSMVYNNTFLFGDKGKDDKLSLNHGVLAKTEIFYAANFFYEGFYYAGEDSEFYANVYKLGYQGICVRDAKVYWITPLNLKEFLKQIRVYTIGAMQIYSNKEIYRLHWREILKLLFGCLVLGTIVACNEKIFIWMPIVIILFMYLLKKIYSIRKIGFPSFLLHTINGYMALYYIVSNSKYLKKENKVHR